MGNYQAENSKITVKYNTLSISANCKHVFTASILPEYYLDIMVGFPLIPISWHIV